MKTYPKIEYLSEKYIGQKVWAFDKLDGSNIRLEWNKKRGWYKFGTRKNMISESDPNFGDAIPIFLEKYSDDLEKIFKSKYSNYQSVVVFGEYLGENSFAGQHLDSDKKDIVLFDVNLYKKGFIEPQEFVDNFGHLHIPKLIYNSYFDEDFIKSVKNNEFNLTEGVICKGIQKTKGENLIWMTKIKTNDWLQKVKSLYGEKAFKNEFY